MAKGQAFLSDFSISMAVFGIILVAFFIPWNSVIESDTRFSESEEMKTQAKRTASFLVTTRGYPNDWEKDGKEVVVPGFVNEDNVISMEKLIEFGSIGFEEQRSLLKNQGFSLEFYDTDTDKIVDYNESKYPDDGGLEYENPFNVGKDIPDSAETVVVVDRQVVINKSDRYQKAEMRLKTWK